MFFSRQHENTGREFNLYPMTPLPPPFAGFAAEFLSVEYPSEKKWRAEKCSYNELKHFKKDPQSC